MECESELAEALDEALGRGLLRLKDGSLPRLTLEGLHSVVLAPHSHERMLERDFLDRYWPDLVQLVEDPPGLRPESDLPVTLEDLGVVQGDESDVPF